MSAPEVRVERRADYAFDVICDECGRIAAGYVSRGWADRRAELHHAAHHDEALADLQARWDARDEAERALIRKWRREADEMSRNPRNAAIAAAVRADADELERAIGGGES